MSYEALAGLLCEAFSATFGVHLVPESLRASEEQRANELLASKYTQERWNLHAKQNRS
jgi:lipoate-protein ligase A